MGERQDPPAKRTVISDQISAIGKQGEAYTEVAEDTECAEGRKPKTQVRNRTWGTRHEPQGVGHPRSVRTRRISHPAFSRANGPENSDAFFNCREVFVAGSQRGVAIGSQGGGETIGIGEFELSAQFGRGAR